ncbi:MAG: phosphoenolpyruvate--protein phosphotransferase, partial [Lactobacillus iners]|nr:phosphoenolpyruvate--protein phosphotransferase [Lactobacillus iners]
LSMGLDEYSMSATSILRIRSLMKKISLEDVKELANEACYVSETFEDNAKLVAETLKKLNIN